MLVKFLYCCVRLLNKFGYWYLVLYFFKVVVEDIFGMFCLVIDE